MDLITITAATVFSMYLNASKTSGYYYNADIQNDKIFSLTVYKENGDLLTGKLKYEYAYDGQDRMTAKKVSRWSTHYNKWIRCYSLNYNYTNTGYDIERMKWNDHDQAYNEPIDKAVYSMFINNVTSVAQYKWNDRSHDFVMTDKMLVMSPQYDLVER